MTLNNAGALGSEEYPYFSLLLGPFRHEMVVPVKVSFIISYLLTPPLGQDMTQGQFLKQSLTGLNSEFSFS